MIDQHPRFRAASGTRSWSWRSRRFMENGKVVDSSSAGHVPNLVDDATVKREGNIFAGLVAFVQVVVLVVYWAVGFKYHLGGD